MLLAVLLPAVFAAAAVLLVAREREAVGLSDPRPAATLAQPGRALARARRAPAAAVRAAGTGRARAPSRSSRSREESAPLRPSGSRFPRRTSTLRCAR